MGDHVRAHDHVGGLAHDEALVQRPCPEQECHWRQPGRARLLWQADSRAEWCEDLAQADEWRAVCVRAHVPRAVWNSG